jgi:ribosome-associated protein
MTTSTRTEASAKKDVTKLQRAIVDGLEDVKAQDIQVFNTEKLSPLFERVIVASGTSNRQTKALASSVRDALREAGFAKPRTEGEDNGEWIIVDCGPAVVHIMQPAIRQYYHLEELWGGTPVRLKLGAAKPVLAKAEAKPAAAKKAAKPKTSAKTLTPAEAKKAAKARREAEKTIAPQRSVLSPEPPVQMAAEKPSRRAVARKTAATKAAAPAAPAKAPAKKAVVKTVVVKPIAKKPAAKKAPARKPDARKA